MAKVVTRIVEGTRKAAKKALEKVETRILVAEGRKAVKAKARTAGRVSRKAAKTGLIVGALAATGVVVREIRKRQRQD